MTRWRKSSHSSSDQQGGCVEVAPLRAHVAIRDSKDPSGPCLRIRPAAWQTLLSAIRRGSVEQFLN